MSYAYSEQDRIANPHTYQYTPYQGKEFLRLYKEARKKHCRLIFEKNGNGLREQNFKPLCNWIADDSIRLNRDEVSRVFTCINKNLISKDRQNKLLASFVAHNSMDTCEMLMCAALILIDINEYTSLYEILSFYIKKYEVTKKLYTTYDKDRKPSSNEFGRIAAYNLLSFCLLKYYNMIPNLKFLSCAIKLNDTLCSLNDMGERDMSLLLLNLHLEHNEVEELMLKKRINI